MSNQVIWRDSIYPEQINIGLKLSNGNYVLWFSCSIDAVWDIFGKDMYDWVKKLPPGAPTPIKMTLEPQP